MKFVSIDGTMKRAAHTSGMTFAIGKDPVEVPVYDPEHETGVRGLQECVLSSGCVPYKGKAEAPAEVMTETPKASETVVPEGYKKGAFGRLVPVEK